MLKALWVKFVFTVPHPDRESSFLKGNSTNFTHRCDYRSWGVLLQTSGKKIVVSPLWLQRNLHVVWKTACNDVTRWLRCIVGNLCLVLYLHCSHLFCCVCASVVWFEHFRLVFSCLRKILDSRCFEVKLILCCIDFIMGRRVNLCLFITCLIACLFIKMVWCLSRTSSDFGECWGTWSMTPLRSRMRRRLRRSSESTPLYLEVTNTITQLIVNLPQGDCWLVFWLYGFPEPYQRLN